MRLYASLCNGPTIPLSALASYSDTTSALLSSAWPNQTTSKWHAACGRFDRQVLKNSWIKACSFQPFPTARNTRVFCWAWLGLVLQWEEHAMRCTAVWDLQKGGCDHESWEKAQFSFGSVCLFFFKQWLICNTIFELKKILVSVALEARQLLQSFAHRRCSHG